MEPMMEQPTSTEGKDNIVPMPEREAMVKKWTSRIRKAREHWEADFKRIRENMEFAAGFQWAGQEELDSDAYINNVTLRAVNQKVAALYARDPKITARRRRRLDFQMWDGRIESIEQAAALSMLPASRPEDRLASMAMLADYANGRRFRDMIDRVGQTMEVLFGWQIDNQLPNFKKQMKALVRRVVTTGVGYVGVHFVRDVESILTEQPVESTIKDRASRMQHIIERIQDGDLMEDSPEVEELRSLINSLNVSTDADLVREKLVFEFPNTTSIIVDPACKQLKDFVGARWIAQQYVLPVEGVNAFFGVNLHSGTNSLVRYNGMDLKESIGNSDKAEDCMHVCIWKVFHLPTRSMFYICDGHNDYLQEPMPVEPRLKRFWPIFALTFNDIEVEPGQQKASIYPPSDVQLMKAPQKEWNRTRNGLRRHRISNKPIYFAGKGTLQDDDVSAIEKAPDNSVVILDGLPPGTDINKVIGALQKVPIDPSLYDTGPLKEDIFSAVNGNEAANTPSAPDTTATAATINEQSRIMVTGSNVDDLDDLLSDIAEASGEIMMQEISLETVQDIVGPGAVWPQSMENRDKFVNYVYLTVVASSSGRPNKALEVANFQQIAPILIQAGANPHFIVREAIKRLDDRLDPDEAFPFGPGQAATAMPMQAASPANNKATAPASSGQPSRGSNAPNPSGQTPAATVPRPKVERPQVG